MAKVLEVPLKEVRRVSSKPRAVIGLEVETGAIKPMPGFGSSMLAFGVHSMDTNGNVLISREVNLELIPEDTATSTSTFWSSPLNHEIVSKLSIDRNDPYSAITFLAKDIHSLQVKYQLEWACTHDAYSWMNWYSVKYLGYRIVGPATNALDMIISYDGPMAPPASPGYTELPEYSTRRLAWYQAHVYSVCAWKPTRSTNP